MSNVTQLIYAKIEEKRVALGNTRRGLKEVCSDFLCDDIGQNRKRLNMVASSAFLSPHAVARVMDCEERYRPQADTLERILRYYNVQINCTEETIKAKYQNKPKETICKTSN